MDNDEKTGFRIGIEWWLLLGSVLLLICRVVEPVWDRLAWFVSSAIWLVDVRNWSRMGWFVVNLVVIVVLFFLIARRDR
jgi:hypothetical protein